MKARKHRDRNYKKRIVEEYLSGTSSALDESWKAAGGDEEPAIGRCCSSAGSAALRRAGPPRSTGPSCR